MELKDLHQSYDMTEYKNQIKNYDEEELRKEQQKLHEKMNINYLCLGDGYYSVRKINIADNPDEKNRVYVRKKVMFLSALISGHLGVYVEDYAPYRNYINKVFMNSTHFPDYVTVNLKGKSVAFADKLSLKGMIAYKNFLMFLYDDLKNKDLGFKEAVYFALGQEIDVDGNLDRNRFYSSRFLPKSINTTYKNLLKEKVINEKLKTFGLEKEQA